MSKRSSKARKPANPPAHQAGMINEAQSYQSCPDCNLRGALTSTTLSPTHERDPFRKRALKRGRVIGVRFSPSTVDACETCGGTGRIPRGKKGEPYDRDSFHKPSRVTPGK